MTASSIFEIIKDYQFDYQERKFEISVKHIQNWAGQFGADADFVLTEMLHILPEIYISKEKAKELLHNRLLDFQRFHKYSSMNEFVLNAHFIDSQKVHKSQHELLVLIDEILQTNYLIDYNALKNEPKKHYIYFDDILATGGTIARDLELWLNQEENGIKNKIAVMNKSKTLAISLFCYHTLGFVNLEWKLMKLAGDKIKELLIVRTNYIIENNLKTKWQAEQQRLNCAYPTVNQPKEVLDYLNALEALDEKVPAYRQVHLPTNESFFSNSENRTKLENIFLRKGVELLNKVKSESRDLRKRPLGDTVRSHKTFGTGTLFFTWRNISNTCPLVFWWDVPGHNWTPLFCVKNRG